MHMHPHQQVIESLFEGLHRLDAQAMASCYADEAMFDDEVYSLRGKQDIASLWRMRCDRIRADGEDAWKLAWDLLKVDDYEASVQWEARLRHGPKRRPVHLRVDSRFGFSDSGLVLVQRDRFDFGAWARQALGLEGLLLAWSPARRMRFRQQAARELDQRRAPNTWVQ